MRTVGVITTGVSPHLIATRSQNHGAGSRDLSSILFVGETQGRYRLVPVGVSEQGKWESKLFHHCRVLGDIVGAQSKDTAPRSEKLVMSVGENGQLAVAVTSEVTTVESDHRGRVPVVRQSEVLSRSIDNCEINRHHSPPFRELVAPLLACPPSCSFPLVARAWPDG